MQCSDCLLVNFESARVEKELEWLWNLVSCVLSCKCWNLAILDAFRVVSSASVRIIPALGFISWYFSWETCRSFTAGARAVKLREPWLEEIGGKPHPVRAISRH